MTEALLSRPTHSDETHFIRADDGLPLTMIRVRGSQEPTKGPVVLVHGAGVRAELFRPPVERTVVDALIADGWDVWLLNWRASIDLDPRSVDAGRCGRLRPPGRGALRRGRDRRPLA